MNGEWGKSEIRVKSTTAGIYSELTFQKPMLLSNGERNGKKARSVHAPDSYHEPTRWKASLTCS